MNRESRGLSMVSMVSMGSINVYQWGQTKLGQTKLKTIETLI